MHFIGKQQLRCRSLKVLQAHHPSMYCCLVLTAQICNRHAS